MWAVSRASSRVEQAERDTDAPLFVLHFTLPNDMTSATEDPLPTVTATQIGEYVRRHSCQRRFKLDFDSRSEVKRVPFAERLFNDLDPVLQEAGILHWID